MNETTKKFLWTAAALGVLGAAALLIFQKREEPAEAEEPAEPAEKVAVYPLRYKYADYERDTRETVYVLLLDTPEGEKSLSVKRAQYDDCRTGDLILCKETAGGLTLL